MKLSAFIHDQYGKPSSMRIALLLPIGIVFIVWTYLSLSQQAILDMPTGLVALIIGLVAGNIGKAAFEKAAVTTTESVRTMSPEGASTSMSKTSETAPVPAPRTDETDS